MDAAYGSGEFTAISAQLLSRNSENGAFEKKGRFLFQPVELYTKIQKDHPIAIVCSFFIPKTHFLKLNSKHPFTFWLFMKTPSSKNKSKSTAHASNPRWNT